MNLSSLKKFATSRAGLLTGVAAAAGAATAVWVERQARRAEREQPPTGRILDVDGVRVHCVERGAGPPVVLIHGNLVSLLDYEASGLIDRLAERHRVIAFDRPGFGHSSRPRDRLWTPTAQAELLRKAMLQLGVERPVVVGHSMGTLVALAMALDHPAELSGVVVLGGYHYRALRVDAVLTAPVALPVLGDAMRYTVTALSGRLMLETMVKGMFWPKEVPDAFFQVLSREMLLRPVQLRANAEDAAFMMPAVAAAAERYRTLTLPVAIIAGNDDKVVEAETHSLRLHAELPNSTLALVPDVGHMVHYAVPEKVAAAVEGCFAKAALPLQAVFAPARSADDRDAAAPALARVAEPLAAL